MISTYRPSCGPVVRAAALIAASGAVLLPAQGRAQQTADELAPRTWSVRLGIGAGVSPEYPGSETFGVSPIPLIDIAYRADLPLLDTIFLNTRDGLGVVLLRRGPFSMGASVGYAPGRDQDDDDRLRGMDDIDGAARGKVFVRGEFGMFGVRLEAERAFGDQDGTTITLGASAKHRVSASLRLVGQVGVTWADSDHMQQWFGVDSVQAQRSLFTAYQPGSGFRDVHASLTGVYDISPSWSATATIGVAQLLGDAADSPLVERATQPFGLLGISYRF